RLPEYPGRHVDVALRRKAPQEGIRPGRVGLPRQAVRGRGAVGGRAAACRAITAGGDGMSRPIRVVVVDDSPFVCRLMTSFLQSDQDVQVIATALDGQRAMEQVRRLKPDAVTLDLEMPGMNGLEVLDRIMHEMPTPVLIVSGVSRQGAAKTMVALEK